MFCHSNSSVCVLCVTLQSNRNAKEKNHDICSAYNYSIHMNEYFAF